MDPFARALRLMKELGRPGLLAQDTHWHDDEGRLVELSAFTAADLQTIDAELRHHAFELAAATLVIDLDTRADGLPTGEEVTHSLTGHHVLDLTAEDWLETTALMRALRRTLGARRCG